MGISIGLLLAKIQHHPRIRLGLLAAITIVAAGLRLYKLGDWSFWFDEVATVNRALVHYSSFQGILNRPFPGSVLMPLSVYLTGQLFSQVGVSEQSARLIPALLGILTIPVVYFISRSWLGEGVALASAAILAVSPWHLFWSQNARFYTSLLLFTLLALFSFFHALERDRPVWIALGYVFLYIALSERLTALLAFLGFAVFVALLHILRIEKPRGYARRNYLLFFLPGLAFLALEILLLSTTGSSFLRDAVEVFGPDRGPSPFRLVYRIVLDMGVPVAGIGALGGLFLLLRRSRIGLFLASMAVAPIGLLVAANPFLFTDDRYAFIAFPAWVLLSAVTMKEVFERIKLSNYGALFALALPLLVIWSDVFVDMRYFQSNQGHRLDWRAAFEVVASRRQESDAVASYWPELANYYLEGQTLSMVELRPDDRLISGGRVWFVIDDYALWSAPALSTWVLRECDLTFSEELLLERPHTLRVFLCDQTGGVSLE